MESAILPKHAFSPLRQKEAVFWDNSILSAPKAAEHISLLALGWLIYS